jgi:hypothetical protein
MNPMKLFKRGLKPHSIWHRRLFMSRYMDVRTALNTLPVAPPSLDLGKGVEYDMQDNDVVGDCGPAAYVHASQTWKARNGNMTLPELDEALHLYMLSTGYDPTQIDAHGNNPTDQGVDPFTFCDWLKTHGYIAAWAEVDHSQLVPQCINTFGGLLTAVHLPDNADQQFTEIHAWQYVGMHPDPNDGHFIYEAGYDANGDGHVVTWGAEIPADAAWLKHCVILRIAVFSDDQLNEEGLNVLGLNGAQLLADNAAL